MAIVQSPTAEEATGVVAEIYASDIRDQGFVAAHTRALSLNPEAYLAWEELIGAIAGPMDKRRYELVTLAAARGAASAHCLLAHGQKSLRYFDEDTLVAIATDYHSAPLTDSEIAMMDFAQRVSADAAGMTEADSITLRHVGFTDREIVDITLAAAARNFYSRAVQALAVELEPPADMSDRLKHALIDGI